MPRPYVSINFAVSADGKITSPTGLPSGWTSVEDSERLTRLRKSADALMVGRGTLEADRMTLRAPHHPLRCVVSRSGKFDPDHPLFASEGGEIHLLAAERFDPEIPGTTLHIGSLSGFLETLAATHGVARLHCEGGGSLVRELAELDAIDEIHMTWAGHRLFAGAETPGITGPPAAFLPATRHFELHHFEAREDLGECFLSFRRTSAQTS